MGDATNAAAEFTDTVGASGVIFDKELTPALEEWADGASEAFGASKQLALEAANQFAIFGKSAGLAGDDLMKFSTDLVQLGGDLASFFGGSTEEAISAVGSALRGEFEPIRRYGVLLNDASLKDAAFRAGIIETTTQALTPQQKVLAAQAAIFDQTTDAQGDFARTSDGMANTQRELTAEFENLRIEIGEKVMPIMLALATWIKDDGIPLLNAFIDALSNLGNENSADDIPFVGQMEDFLNFVGGELPLRIRASMTGIQTEIARASEKTGESWVDLYNAMRASMDAFGGTEHEALARVLELIEQYGSLDAALEAIENEFGATSAAADANAARIEARALRVDRAYGDEEQAVAGLSAKTEEEMAAIAAAAEEAHDAAVQEVSDMFDELIGLFSKDDFEQAVEDFHEMLNDPWPDTRRRAAIESTLASEEVAEGLRSKDSSVRAETLAFVNDLIEQYETMAPGALAAGELVNPKLQEGLQANLAQTLQVAEGIAIATGNELDFREWAEDAGLSGLLSFQTGINSQRSAVASTAQQVAGLARANLYFDASSGGASSAWTFVNGLAGVLESWSAATRLQNAAQLLKTRSLGGSLPTAGPFSRGPLEAGAESIGDYWIKALGDTVSGGLMNLRFAPAAPMAGIGSPAAVSGVGTAGRTVQYILNVGGVPKEFTSRDDFIRALDDLGAFGGDGRID